jgi:cation-transporting ATPase E
VSLVDEVPFSSARKWSAVAVDSDGLRGVYALGAPEMLGPLLASAPGSPPAAWMDEGLRVLLAAGSPQPASLHDDDRQPELPPGMEPLAWVALADVLRPDCREAIAGFQDAGIALKIISGDNPETVAALARQAGLRGEITLVSGPELAEMDDGALEDAAVRGTVFGRTTPDQKSRLVGALKRRGYYVAMTGDGVNDVPSLKQADLGIAMESGSQATRMVADIVLLGDSFGALPAAFTEGQRVRRGLQDVMSLFLTRVTVVTIALVLCAVVDIGFPFSPGNVTLLTLLTVGIPTFGLALWAKPGAPPRSMTRALVSFVLPAAVSLSFAAFAVFTAYFLIYDIDLADLRAAQGGDLLSGNPIARDALTYLLILGGLALVPFASPPTDWWSVFGERDRDWRPTLLALAMLPLYAVVLAVPPLRDFFGTRLLSPGQYVVIALIAGLWVLALRHAYRTRLIDRFLGIA